MSLSPVSSASAFRATASVARHAHLEEQLGAGRGRKKLLLHEAEARERAGEQQHRHDQDRLAPVEAEIDHAAQRPIDAGVVDRVRVFVRAMLRQVRQELQPEIRREHNRDEPRGDQRETDDPEDSAGIFARARLGEADREEARGSHQRAGQHRKRGRGPGEGRGAAAIPALLHLHHHHLDRDDRVVDQKAERNDQCAERDAVQVEAPCVHHDENDREHQRHRQRHHDAGAPAEREEADHQHDRERLGEAAQEFRDRVFDDLRLVRDLRHLDPDRQLEGDRAHRILQVFAERHDVGAVLHRDAEAERRLAAGAHQEAGRILVAALHLRDVAQTEHAAIRLHRHRRDRVDAVECPGDAQVDAVRRGVDRPARHHGVLPRDAVEDLLRREAERREPGMAELDEDALRPFTDDVHLVDVGNAQQPLADVLGAGLQFGERQPVG
jgi:hypothetical protein